VLDVLINVFGSDRVGVRLSPTDRYNEMYDSNPKELMKYVLKELDKKNLFFVEVKTHGYESVRTPVEVGGNIDSDGHILPEL